MKKSSKRLTISTEAKNSNGFRVRTAGIDLSHFQKNPLLLWMHKRPKGESKDEILPLGYWEDIETNNGEVSGIPVFDDTDPFALTIYNKVENGTLKAASAGLLPVEFAESNGEKWLEQSLLKEGTICDIGSNHEALTVVLYNENDQLVTLAEALISNTTNTLTDMKLIQLSAPTVGLLKLAEGATEAEAHTAILNLVTLAATQKTELEAAAAEKATLELKLEEAGKAEKKAELVTLVNTAEADRKITKDQVPHFLQLGEKDFDGTKALLDTMPKNPSAASQVATEAKGADGLMKLSYKELDSSGKLITLKEQNLEGFKAKFKEHWGVDYQA